MASTEVNDVAISYFNSLITCVSFSSLDESGFTAIPLAANNIVLVAIGYDIAPSGNTITH